MPLLNISEASKVVKKSRATLHKYINNGRLSIVIGDDGQKKIDTSELLRVFGELVSPGDTVTVQNEQPFTGVTVDSLKAQIALLQEELRNAHDREKVALEREEKLMSMLEQHTLALPAAVAAITPKPMSLWERIFGRKE